MVQHLADLVDASAYADRPVDAFRALIEQRAVRLRELPQLLRVDDLQPLDDRHEKDGVAFAFVEDARRPALDRGRPVALLDVPLVGGELFVGRWCADFHGRCGGTGWRLGRHGRQPSTCRAKRTPIDPVPTKFPWRLAVRATSPGRFQAPPRQTRLSALQSN